MTDIIAIKNEINTQIADKEVFASLMDTTFNGLQPAIAKRAMLEGALRGFTLEDFLQKNVYAIPFKGGYSLVTSIDYARKIGMRSGVVGKSKPIYELDDDKKVVSCTITVKKKVGDYIGDYSATVFFIEYTTGFNLWKSKPKTMIAKVAEVHALRMACPEELSQSYIEEERQSDILVEDLIASDKKAEIDAITDLGELRQYYKSNAGKGKDIDEYITQRADQLKNEVGHI